MPTAVVTDGKYRSAIAAARALGRAGYQVVVTQTRDDASGGPPAFASRFTAQGRWISGSWKDGEYPARLLSLLAEYQRPVLFPVGAATLNAVARRREDFARVSDFLISPPQVLDALNDKEQVHARGAELGIPVPRQYAGEPEAYPAVVKPRCGERFGLKARDRYALARDREEYLHARAAMERYDPDPIVQQRVTGPGLGASLLLDREGRLIGALCHRRIREYPITGGPSTCCESFYDEALIQRAYRLLSSFGFVGLAMVEFKGAHLLEVNPRVWGSFPMTERAESPLTLRYARAAAGERLDYDPCDYRTGVRMRFVLNDAAAALSYFRHGRLGEGFGGIADLFRAKEALSCPGDGAPLRQYLKNTLLRR